MSAGPCPQRRRRKPDNHKLVRRTGHPAPRTSQSDRLQCDLFAERCSSNLFDANTVRLYLSTFAHVLCNRLRQALEPTRLARANPTTLALAVIRIGARVRLSARRIHVAMSSACPDKGAFAAAWKALAPG